MRTAKDYCNRMNVSGRFPFVSHGAAFKKILPTQILFPFAFSGIRGLCIFFVSFSLLAQFGGNRVLIVITDCTFGVSHLQEMANQNNLQTGAWEILKYLCVQEKRVCSSWETFVDAV